MPNKQVGRLAMRAEGDNWNAYYALSDTMDDAFLLASINLLLIDTKELKDEYLEFISKGLKHAIKEITGDEDCLMAPIPAPEHERGK